MISIVPQKFWAYVKVSSENHVDIRSFERRAMIYATGSLEKLLISPTFSPIA